MKYRWLIVVGPVSFAVLESARKRARKHDMMLDHYRRMSYDELAAAMDELEE